VCLSDERRRIKTMAKIKVQKGNDAIPDSTRRQETGGLAESIRQRAFCLFEARNYEPGHELTDWLEAERQILAEAFGQRHTPDQICGPEEPAGVPSTAELAKVAAAGRTPP
jgi:hypothetical protein